MSARTLPTPLASYLTLLKFSFPLGMLPISKYGQFRGSRTREISLSALFQYIGSSMCLKLNWMCDGVLGLREMGGKGPGPDVQMRE